MEEKILKYLNNEMSNEEKDNFEKILEDNPTCREDLEQTSLLKAAFSTKFIENLVRDNMIEDYLNDAMTDEERVWFESSLEENEDLRSELNAHSLLKASFAVKIIADAARQEDENKKKRFRLNMLSSAAVFIGVVMASCGMVDKYNGHLSTEGIDLEYKEIRVEGKRGTGDLVVDALDKYKYENLEGALEELNKVDENDALYSDAMYVKGMILLKEKWFSKEAIDCLEKSNNTQSKELLGKLWLKYLYKL